ncbi:hypothetical protein [Defluviicoccus vanus]|uniref:Uncharacterized protein n=1 Tax=Defluviicoccus vanus TaxID=111831 RepID=A0A7H1MYN8_9PROT|nr:hypothetical protein [Defluviicoccus vanus]QNT68574.1 hypothetical protein HQ394_03315 [Defluviicoccus vanus]
MTTHAELAARLLREAAIIFRTINLPDVEVQQRLDTFGKLYERVAELVEQAPTDRLDPATIEEF